MDGALRGLEKEKESQAVVYGTAHAVTCPTVGFLAQVQAHRHTQVH